MAKKKRKNTKPKQEKKAYIPKGKNKRLKKKYSESPKPSRREQQKELQRAARVEYEKQVKRQKQKQKKKDTEAKRQQANYNRMIAAGVPESVAGLTKNKRASQATVNAIIAQYEADRRAKATAAAMKAGKAKRKRDSGNLYLIVGIKDVTESDNVYDYVQEVKKAGRRTASKDLTQNILDALNNPDMDRMGMIGKAYFYIADGKSEANKIQAELYRKEITVVYNGQGVYLQPIKVAINIAMSLLYFADERDQFIVSFVDYLRKMDSEAAKRNADIIAKEFL